MPKTDWNKAIKPLLKKYRNKKHPLDFQDRYQLMVMVILSAQSTDKLINEITQPLFKAYPSLEALGRATVDDLRPYIGKVRSFFKKAAWLIYNAQKLKEEKNIPVTMEELVKLPGIGRKSANVIMRESGVKVEGIVVDLHVLRVAPRLGIGKSDDAKTLEKELMKNIDEKYWGEFGMAVSFLGREICRPTEPLHEQCVMKNVCAHYARIKKKK